MMAIPHDLILASASPRRATILRELGLNFEIVPADIDESVLESESPQDYVTRVALAKAQTVNIAQQALKPVLGADTVVVIRDRILGKPDSEAHAIEMLNLLSGQWHDVYTGVAVTQAQARFIVVGTKVKFRAITRREMSIYWSTGEPRDKAGAYAIQGLGGAFVERIDGSYSNVVGLPMVETLTLLASYRTRTIFSDDPGTPCT